MRGKSVFLLFSVVLLVFMVSSVAFGAELERVVQGQFMQARSLARQAIANLSHGVSVSEELAGLGELAERLQVDHLLLQARFDSRSERVAGFLEDIQQRQQRMQRHYEERVSDFLSTVASLFSLANPVTSDFQSLIRLIDEILPAKKYPLFGSLPYQNLNWPLRQPIITDDVVPAYLGGDMDVSAADTTSSASAMITPEIAALAESLDWNPVKIYQWVSANIATEWYWGSMKGAAETLRQRSGNDADQAALLIALLRAADFPARYVRGVIEFFPGTQAISDLVGIEDPLQQLSFFQKSGIPVKPVISAGRITNLQIEHLWVETQVPYANYRGTMLDPHDESWLALDTSIKPTGYLWNDPADLDSNLDLIALRDDYLSAPQQQTPLEYLRTRITAQLVGNSSAASYADHLRTRSAVHHPLGILPASLQFKPVSITAEFTELPDQLKHRVTFTASGLDGSQLFTKTYNVSALTSRKLALFFEPESLEDQRLINSYGGLSNTPAYLVRLRPVLMLDGQRSIVAQDGLPMGTDFNLDIELRSPNGSEHFSNQHIIGNLAVIGLVAQQTVLPAEIPVEQKDAQQLLFETALSYIDRWNAAEDELASLLKVAMIRPLPTIVTVGGVIDVTWLFDTPHDFTWKGVFMDAGLRRVEVVARAGRQSDVRDFMRFSALQGSVLEGRVFEDAFQVASISTAKLLGLAAQGSASLLTLDGNNIDLLETLDLAENVRQDIVNAINQGLIVTLPKTEQRYYDWSGIGYLKENPATGEAGYMLSGMIAGSSTAEKWAQGYIKDVLESPFGGESNRDPLAAAHIVKIPVTDYQTQEVGQELSRPLFVLVTDIQGRPVKGAEVTFIAVSGGGGFVAGADTVGADTTGSDKAITGSDGIAEIRVTLGERTSTYVDPVTQTEIRVATVYRRLANDDKHVTQLGENRFAASVESHYGSITMAQPLIAFGQPGPAAKMTKILGDGNAGLANTSGGSIIAGVFDRYGNPVSNAAVTFKVVKALVAGEEPVGITGFRSLQFFDGDECRIANPIFDDCGSTNMAKVESSRIGAVINTMFGNTMNTEYQLQASLVGHSAETNPDSRITLLQNTNGTLQQGEYLPPQLMVRKLVDVNRHGDPVAAAKVATEYGKPLTARLVMVTNDYAMGPEEVCQEPAEPSQTFRCWRIIGSPVIKTKKVNDGVVKFKAVHGGGSVNCGASGSGLEPEADGWISCQDQTSIDTVADSLYKALFTTGSKALLNWVEARGEVEITVPEVYFKDLATADALETGYRSATLKMKKVTLQTGQMALFNPSTKELLPREARGVTFGVYGVKLDAAMVQDYVLLNSIGEYRDDSVGEDSDDRLRQITANQEEISFDYTISPQASGMDPAYEAYSAQIDLYVDGNWAGFLIGDALSGNGSARIGYGSQWQLGKQYEAALILNRGHDGLEINGDRFPLKLLLADLDIDSDNNAGWNVDGTHQLPNRSPLEDQTEALSGSAGKVLRSNSLDVDGDGVPGFADGLDKFDNAGENASTPFVPILLEINGDINLAQATVRFNYSASDPNGISRTGDETTGYSFEPAPGNLRLWSKDGGQSRSIASISAGGDFIIAGQDYSLSDLGKKTDNGYWLFWVEGIRPTIDPEQGQISIDVKLSGNLVASDRVQTTVRSLALVPDYNHDRKIDAEDRNRALAGDSYYFWINDDDDSGETGGTDIPGDTGFFGKLDWDNKKIDGVRDLVDFFPVYLDIHELLQLFDPARYVYKLSNQDGALNFAYSHLDYGPEGNVGDYLTDVETARNLSTRDVFTVTQEGAVLNKDSLLLWQQDEKKGVLLFEGRKKTVEALVLSVYDGAGNQVFRQSLNISLDGVEQMFRHKNLIKELRDYYPGEGLPGRDPVPDTGMSDRIKVEDTGFANKAHFTGFDSESDENNFIHVHGYNVNDQTARGEQSEAFKRFYWSGSKAKFWAITWYGWDSQATLPIPGIGTRSPNYHVNVRHAFNTGRLLRDFVNVEVPGNVTVFGHSLGNMVVSSAISEEEGMNVDRYLMVNSAVAEEAYTSESVYDGGASYAANSSWQSATKEPMYHPAWRYPDGQEVALAEGYQPFLWASEWYKLFDDGDGRVNLTWRDSFASVRNMATYVYYTPTDEAFRPFNYTLDMAAADVNGTNYQPNIDDWPGWEDIAQNWSPTNRSKLGHYSWSIQELFKGRFQSWADEDSDAGGWGFNPEHNDLDSPETANNLILNKNMLKTEPFFLKNPDNENLYSDQPVIVSPALQEELLANEIPALTFAAGHRGVEVIRKENRDRDVDIRVKFLIDGSAPWPEDRLDGYEWRHSDIYVVAYPFLSKLYDEWTLKIKGESL